MDITGRAVEDQAAGPEDLIAEVEGVIEIEDSLNGLVRIVDHVLRHLELVEVIFTITGATDRDMR